MRKAQKFGHSLSVSSCRPKTCQKQGLLDYSRKKNNPGVFKKKSCGTSMGLDFSI